MTIPSVVGSEAVLPPGRHQATLDEIEAYFVIDAPFPEERALIFNAFRTWKALVEQIIQVNRYWVDGGFVTHKPWAAPSDVDVMLLCQESDLNALGKEERERLRLLRTITNGGKRAQPMGGKVDAFVIPRSGPDANAGYWHEQWSKVRGADGASLDSEVKGYLEVIP